MDGNLLDPDNADATLAKEWSLPELPPGVEEQLIVTLITRYYEPLLFYLKHTFCLNIELKKHHSRQIVREGEG